MTANVLSTREWWAARRRPYNLALVVAGLLAFLAYAAAVETRCSGVPEVEISGFTTAFQGLGYLLAVGLANLCFNLGSWSERVVRPQDVSLYRRWTWRLGLSVSVALPFAIPIIVAISRCRPL
jgi:hypothetical protein